MSEWNAEQMSAFARDNADRMGTEYDELIIDNVSIPISSIQSTDLARFDGKVTFGDYSADSDQQTSSWIQTSWQGGALIADQVPGATDQRFSWGNLWTQSPKQLALNSKREETTLTWLDPDSFTAGSGTINPVATWNDSVYVASGNALYRIMGTEETDPSLWTVVKIGSLAGNPCDRGVVYGNPEEGTVRLWIPIYRSSATDYVLQTVDYDPATNTHTIHTADTDHHPVSVTTWGRRLYILTVDGYLDYYSELGVWQPGSEYRRIPLDQEPRKVTTFYNKSGDETVFVSTDRQMHVYDPDTDTLVTSSLKIPRFSLSGTSPNGYGFVQWQDDAIYYSSRFGTRRYTSGGVQTPMGLDRDNGIPLGDTLGDGYYPDALGILDLIPSNNMLLAYVHAGSRTVSTVQTYRYYVTGYNTAGWHILAAWDSPNSSFDAATVPNRIMVSDVVGGYRIWIGSGDVTYVSPPGSTIPGQDYSLYSVLIPWEDYGPKQILDQQVGRFESSGRMRVGRFDAQMEGFLKLISHVEVRTEENENVTPGDPMDGTFGIRYRTNTDPLTWIDLPDVTKYGYTTVPIGLDDDGFPRGITCRWFEPEYSMTSNDIGYTPIVRSVNWKFIKLPLFARAWVFQVPLDRALYRDGTGPVDLDRFLATRTTQGPFNKIIVAGRTFRARSAQWQGRESLAADGTKVGVLNFVGLQMTGYDIPGVENL